MAGRISRRPPLPSVPLPASACLPCFVKRKACDKTLPVCGRCLRSKNPNMKCTYRNEDVDALGSAAKSLGVEQAARDDFIQEAKEFVTRRRTTACFACRVDKRSCEGGGDGACDRCQHKGLVCVFPDQQQQNSSSSEYLLPNNASSSKKKRTSPPMSSVRARPPRRAGDSNKRDNNHGTPSLSPAIVESTSFSSSRWSEHSSILPGGQTMDWFPSTEGGTAIGSSNAVGLPARTFPLLDSDSTIGFGGQSTTPLHFFPGGIPFQQGTTRSLPTELGLLAEVLGLAGRRQAPFASRTAVSPFSLSTSIPIAPSSGWFPDNSTILQCIDIYFAQADITLVMLHKNKVLAAKTHPDLLICSILLVAPHMSHEPVVGRSTPVEVRLWDKWIFQRIKSEMFALFSSSGGDERVTVVALAAVMNLVLWSLFQGLHVLSRQLTVLGRRLLQVLGLVEDAVTLRPPQDLPSWKQVMVAAFGPDVYQRTLTPQESALLRDMWIDYHVRERVAALVLYFSWISKDWLREIDLNADTAFGYPELSRWMPPMPHVWEASFSPSFDPRVLEEPPLLIDVLSPLFMVSNEPRRPAAFARLTEYFVNQRKTVTWVFLILRDQVDKFLAACHEAGYSTPAMLRAVDDDTLFSTMNFRTRELIRRRNQLDETIKLTRASFPPQIITGLESGNANDIVACLMEYSGSFHYAFNHATYFPAIVLLRMELYSSCGVYLTVSGVTDSGSNGDRAAQQDTLAEEFASGGRLFAEFLEDVLLFTRLLESWHSLNPTFSHHLESNLVLIFRVYCLHVSFYKQFQGSMLAQPDDGAAETVTAQALDALSHIEKDIKSCLHVLQLYAEKTPWTAAIYLLALKVTTNEQISVDELARLRQRVDMLEIADAEELEEEVGSVDGGEQKVVKDGRVVEQATVAVVVAKEARQLQNLLVACQTATPEV